MLSKFTFVGLIKELKMKRLITLTLLLSGIFAWATNHQVSVGGAANAFSPSTLTITAGDTVTWTNAGGSHNVNGNMTTFPSNPASFFSGNASSTTWTYSHTFTLAGSYGYQCDPHSIFGMTGTITVNALPPVSTPCSDLFFSEYIEGGSNNKALEIYNPTNATIDLSDYTVYRANNGSTTPGGTLTLNGMLASGDVYVIGNPSSSGVAAKIVAESDTLSSITYFNGDDALWLMNDVTGDTLDIIGVVGVDPGSSWTVGTGETKDYTLVRKSTVDAGTTDWALSATQWDVHPKDTTMFIGAHTSGCVASPAMPCSDLFFSEYIEGSSNNKGFEIYNPTGSSINMSTYNVHIVKNNGDTGTFALYGMIASGDVFAMCTDQADSLMQYEADTVIPYNSLSVVHYNGDDALILVNGTDTLDVIGTPGIDPGSSWPVGIGSTKEFTLVRNVNIDKGFNNWDSTLATANWDVHPQNTYSFYGSHVSNCVAAPASACSDLFISEYIEGTSSNRGIEIYNPTGATINLSGYTVYMLTGSGAQNSFPLYGTLDSDSVMTIVNDAAAPALLSLADTALGYPSIVHYTGDDAIMLVNGTDTIDVFGTPGVDPGDYWTIGSDSTQNITLVRKSSVDQGSTDWTVGGTEWDAYPVNTYSNFGWHISTCIAGPIPPTVSFTSASQTHLEDAGVQSVYMTVSPVSANAETVKVYVMEGTNVTSGDYTLNPAAVMDTLTFNIAANTDSIMFDVTILDDILQESTESITFDIATVSNGLTIGMNSTQVFSIDDNDTPIPTYTIDQIDGLDANFALDSNGVECKIIATVIGVDLAGVSSPNTQFTIHDGDGLGVYSSSATGYVVTEGDEIRIIGTLSQFNGLAQISGDSIVVLSSGNPIPTPTVITAFTETMESELNRVNGVQLVDPSQWTNSGSGFNVDIYNATDTFAMRIDNEVDLYSQPAPTGIFDVIGIGGQFDGSNPMDEGYQILPRYIADVILPTPPTYDIHISEIMPGSVDSDPITSSDWFEITNFGSTTVDLNGFSFDDDSETPGTVTFGNVTIAPNEAIVVWRGVSANEAAFLGAWRATTSAPQVISSDELTGSFPNLGQSGDMVVLYDSSSTFPIEICKAAYSTASAGFSLEFDMACTFAQNAQDGMRGAYTSNKGDVGSPGNATEDISVKENILNDVSVYPNPVQDILFIELSGESEKTEIEIYSIGGQKLMKSSFNSNTYQLNVSELPQGMYLMKLTCGGKMTVKNVVVK